MQANLQALDTWAQTEADADLLELLKAIKGLVFNFEISKSLPDALACAMKTFYRFTQTKTMADEEFLRRYKSNYEVIKQSGGAIGAHTGLIAAQIIKLKIDLTDTAAVGAVLEAVSNTAEEEYMACHLLRQMNWDRHGALINHLENQFTLGVDSYPKTLTQAYNLAIKWKTPGPKNLVTTPTNNEGVTLATEINEGGGGKRDMSQVKCYHCQGMGHIARNCPKKSREEKPAEAVNTTTTAPPSDLSVMTGATNALPAKASGATNADAGSVSGGGPGSIRQVQLSTFVLDSGEFTFLTSVNDRIPVTTGIISSEFFYGTTYC